MYPYPDIDWDELRKFRTDAVKGVMAETGVDHIILTGHDNIRYATDFGVFLICESYDWYAAIVTREGEAYLFIPYVDEVIRDPLPNFPWIREYIPTPSWVSYLTQEEIWIKMLSEKLGQLGANRVAVDSMSFQLYDGLKERLPEIQFSDVFMPLARARQVKHDEEVKLIRVSAEIASLGGGAGLRAMQEGATDFEVVSSIDQKMRSMGAEFITHNVCIKGESQVTAGWFPRGSRLQEGSTMAFDWGCYVKGGYASDMCRTGFVGVPPKEVQAGYKVLMEALQATVSVAKPGIRASTLDKTANDYLRKNGYPTTPYSLGHGVGLRCCELPLIYRPELMTTDAALEKGMVLAIEPETVVESRGETVIVKVEDMYEVTDTGLRQLTTTGYTAFWDG